MAYVDFREVADRFTRIDGELVSRTVALTRDESAVDVVLRFYPWWEHPLYVQHVTTESRGGSLLR